MDSTSAWSVTTRSEMSTS